MSKIGRSGGSTICCQQYGLDCQRLEDVEEVEEVRFVVICCQQFGLECQRLEDLEEVEEVEDLLQAIWA